MKTLLLVLPIFFLTSTCHAEAPSNYIYLSPIIVSAQRHPSSVQSDVLSSSVPVAKATVMRQRFQPEDFEKEDKTTSHFVDGRYAGFLASVSSEYRIKRNILQLTQVPYGKSKDAIMFVFFMNPKKVETKKAVWRDHSRFHMHVMGTKKMFEEQTSIENEYPIDISVSKYEDGYSSEDPNLVLPNKKPRKVMVSLLWSF
ncbi:MAG: hypothetical protein HQL15_08785 [Candidatus Omnitrophica bacterium]|nr:hypothetical protein [Candidatus Omnitrophota bacterium]